MKLKKIEDIVERDTSQRSIRHNISSYIDRINHNNILVIIFFSYNIYYWQLLESWTCRCQRELYQTDVNRKPITIYICK